MEEAQGTRLIDLIMFGAINEEIYGKHSPFIVRESLDNTKRNLGKIEEEFHIIQGRTTT